MMSNWFDLVDKKALKPLPESAELLSDNGISMVYCGGEIYKRTIPYFINNEFVFLKLMHKYAPRCERHDKYTLRIRDLGKSDGITDTAKFVRSCNRFLGELFAQGVRHGDLTKPHVIVKDNEIKVIDWAESRLAGDLALDKRPDGDRYWLNKTMKEIAGVGLND
jgi:hypothetical protein